MATANIEIPLDAKTAKALAKASPDEQKKIRLLLGLWLREFAMSAKPLKQVMDEIGDRARARGLTPEKLESLLHGK